MYGAHGFDNLYGESGRDLLRGASGKDLLDGGADSDKLIGGWGNDTLIGGAGNDVLNGGDDSDTLTGGVGADLFVWANGQDTITDFRIEDGDKIYVKDISQIVFLDSGPNVLLATASGVDLMAGDTMLIQDATRQDVVASMMDSYSYIGLPWGGWNFDLFS